MRFFEWDYDAGTVTEYQRHGKCKRCGVCCKARVSFQVGKPYHDIRRDGGKATNGKGVWQEVRRGNRGYFFSVVTITPSTTYCCMLTPDGLCTDHDAKQNICKLWPMSPRCIEPFPECGYSFTVKEVRPMMRDAFDPRKR